MKRNDLMQDKRFLDTLLEQSQEKELLHVTVIGGEHAGETLLADIENVCYMSHENGVLAGNYEELRRLRGKGCMEFHGEEIYYEWTGSVKRLVICGAGHVGVALVKMAKLLGFYIVVMEDREEFAMQARIAGANEVICADMEEALVKLPERAGTYYVVVTRGHAYDKKCLARIMDKMYVYAGMMGSKRRVTKLLEELEGEGYEAWKLKDIHTPIGLDIAAQTPEEIAVSILAEIIAKKNKRLVLTEIPDAFYEIEDKKQEGVLATIIRRDGSAPREMGTKMLVFSGGKVYGTIGGGLLEQSVLYEIQSVLCKKRIKRRFWVDLSTEDAAKEGSVCGGRVEILLERI